MHFKLYWILNKFLRILRPLCRGIPTCQRQNYGEASGARNLVRVIKVCSIIVFNVQIFWVWCVFIEKKKTNFSFFFHLSFPLKPLLPLKASPCGPQCFIALNHLCQKQLKQKCWCTLITISKVLNFSPKCAKPRNK